MGFQHDETAPPRERRAPSAPVPTLRPVFEAGAIREAPATVLPVGDTVIGRNAPRGIALSDPRCSRRHAVVTREHGGVVRLHDESTHGTFVMGTRVVAPRELRDGDVVRCGDSLLVLRMEPPGLDDVPDIAGLVGVSPAARAVRTAIAELGPARGAVLVLGPSGSGKELVARALHESSGRKGRLVAINCAAIAETLADSILFGHVAGAFTGARSDEPGLFRAASGGTLFLDEIGDLSAALQAKLLRVLESGEVVPVGSTRAVPVDVRVVAATHRDLAGAVERESFRGDLLARLAQLVVRVPPLAERREDVLLILESRLAQPPLSPDLAEALVLAEWPFNVRELVGVAQRLEVRSRRLAPDELLEPDALPAGLVGAPRDVPAASVAPSVAPASAPPEAEVPSRERIEAALARHRGNLAEVARELGRSRMQVYRYLERFGIDARGYRDE